MHLLINLQRVEALQRIFWWGWFSWLSPRINTGSSNNMKPRVLTIGHSTHTLGHLVRLLNMNQINAVADIRSVPYSRLNPQFDRETFIESLKQARINYYYLGSTLGTRPQDPACYKDGKVQFQLMAQNDLFRAELERISLGSVLQRIAIMCSEKEPLTCHRSVLIARELERMGLDVSHILEDGRVETQEATMARLLKQFKLDGGDLFRTRDQLIDDACSRQLERVCILDTA
jgi:uncharacterized protein (DUF488 family)